MIIWGKIVGAIVGLIFYGPAGMILGLVLGQVFDNGLRTIMQTPAHSLLVREVFFRAVFQTMGHLAKADGVVSEQEINVARNIMLHDFHLNPAQMQLAIQYFNEGKQPSFDLAVSIYKFKLVCGKYAELRRFFLELQVKAALADNVLTGVEREILVYICDKLGIPLSELDYQLQAYGFTYTGNTRQQQQRQHHAAQPVDELSAAYKLLGVSASDSIKTIKTAYRRLVSKYHPDKLAAKGLPLEMMNIAKEKTQKITVAYDLIMRSRQ